MPTKDKGVNIRLSTRNYEILTRLKEEKTSQVAKTFHAKSGMKDLGISLSYDSFIQYLMEFYVYMLENHVKELPNG